MARIDIAPQVSNGATAVSLVAAVEGKTVYPTRLVFTNTSATVAQTLILLSDTTEMERYYLPAGGTIGFAPEDLKTVQSGIGAALKYKQVAAGTSVYASGVAEQR